MPNDVRMGPEEGLFLLITGPNMGGKCLRGDSLIFTDRGLLSLESLKPAVSPVDAFVPLGCGVQGREGPARATHFYNGGVCPTVRITTALGFSLEGTREHRIWVRQSDGQKAGNVLKRWHAVTVWQINEV